MKRFTDIEGVYAGGISSGIKSGKKLDLGYIFVPDAVASAAVFTQNQFAAAPVQITQKHAQNNTLKAMIINSGNANACTGKTGLIDAQNMGRQTAKKLGIAEQEIGVASTGIIGVPLPMDNIMDGIDRLLADPYQKNGQAATEAIMTTDTRPKPIYCESEGAVVAGMVKGSGMIAPNMATMLGFFVTNVMFESDLFQTVVRQAVQNSFNMISVDTDTSTNDMVVCFSTGQLSPSVLKSSGIAESLIQDAFIEGAKAIMQDGEGSNRVLEVRVEGAKTEEEARQVAKAIAESPLVKTAVHGADPNWGRVLAAAGKTDSIDMNPETVDLFFGDKQIVKQGQPLAIDRDEFVPILKKPEVGITLALNIGSKAATFWGCELTKGYVDINTEYS